MARIVSAVLQTILTPIMELVGFLLRTIIGPILNTVLPPVIQFALDLVMKVMASVFYTILKSLLQIVEVIESCFKIFSGIAAVTFNGRQTDLLRLFVLENNSVTRAFWILTVLCFALCIAFTMYATARSALDFDFENKRPIGKILGGLGKAGLTFLLVPLFAMFAIRMSSVVMVQVYNVTQTEGLSVADTVFQISAMTANKNAEHNLSSTQTFTSGMRSQYNNGGWKNIDRVRDNFNLEKFDYVLGFGLSIFMLINFATIAFVFVQRLYEIMLLYISAPFFVSSMPLDDGQKYGAWRDMFIAKLVSGMGTIVMVNLFLMAVPIVMDDSLRLDPRAGALSADNVTYNYLLKIVFVIGGALAVKQGGSMITSIVNYQAGMQESQTTMQAGMTIKSAAAVGGSVALAVGKTAVAKPLLFAGRMGLRGAQYGLTKKMLEGGENPTSKVTRGLRAVYGFGSEVKAGWGEVKDTGRRANAFIHGDFAGADKVHGKDTYESMRSQAYQSGNMTEFMRLGNPEVRGQIQAKDQKNAQKRTDNARYNARPWEPRPAPAPRPNAAPPPKANAAPPPKSGKPDDNTVSRQKLE